MTKATSSNLKLTVKPVISRGDRRRFLTFPQQIYGDDPLYVQPLDMEMNAVLRGRNAWSQHAKLQAWLAWQGNQVVGRITAQRDQLHTNPQIGQFGFLESTNDAGVFKALLDTAAQWLSQQGASTLQGPFDPSINAQTGLLIQGFDTPPYMMMGHAPRYYQQRYLEYGLQPVQELLAYMLDAMFVAPKIMTRLARGYRSKVRIREPDWRNRAGEMEIMRDIFNDAWADNWEFVPYTEAEFKQLGEHLKMLVRPGWVQIVEYEDRPIAFIVVLPNMNDMIRGLRGKLFPLGIFKLLWRLKMQTVRNGRVPLMGVRREYHGTPLAGAIAFLMIEQLQINSTPFGLRNVELSWILKDNKGMRDIIEAISGQPYKRYHVYAKSI